MKIDQQEIRVVPATTDPATGEKLEPEERPAEIRNYTAMPLVMGSDPRNVSFAGPSLTVRGVVSVDMVAGEVADALRKRCADCRHYDRKAWMHLYRQWRVGSYEEQQKLNALRATASSVGDEDYRQKHMDAEQGEVDVEHAIQDMGICHALTDYWSKILGRNEEMLFAPECGCPDEFGPDNTYLGRLFMPRDGGAAKRGAQQYDKVMQAAAGRTPVVKPKK